MSKPTDELQILDAVLRVDNLPSKGRELKIEACEKQLRAIEKYLKIERVEKFSAKLLATPIKAGFIASGKLNATIVQASVISFKPVVQHIDENLQRVFLFGDKETIQYEAGSESFIDLEGDDLPDYYLDREIDFSNYLLETLALAIDLFPRNEGEKLHLSQNSDEQKDISPFAQLKKLKFN